MDGYAGKIADIDLTRNRVTITTTLSDWKKRYLGDRGFGARAVTARIYPHDDPLIDRNIFVPAAGLTIVRICTASRINYPRYGM